MSDLHRLIDKTAATIADYRERLAELPVRAEASLDDVRAALGGPLAASGLPAPDVVDDLVAAAMPGLVASDGPRYFGFVVGGSTDAALCADLLTVGWDQLAFNHVSSPAAAVAEEVASGWLKELLGIPSSATCGFVTGAQGANTVGLLAARHHVLAAAGWDVERDGLIGAPRVRVVVGAERHATIDRTLRLVGFGTASVVEVPARDDGTMDTSALPAVLAAEPTAPTIVCAQAGNVNTGACDDLRAVCTAARDRATPAWVHVDGAFGLWAAASPATRHLVDGLELADSWACDGHKWLNIPYDSGFAFCAHPESHVGAIGFTAAYLSAHQAAGLEPSDLAPESSRRARGFAVWAALRSLGRDGVAELVERNCRQARRFAERLDAIDGIDVVNDVVLNQVLVRFGDGDPERTDRIVEAVQHDGTCWLGATTWHGMRLARISVSNWLTTDDDVDRSVEAIARCATAT